VRDGLILRRGNGFCVSPSPVNRMFLFRQMFLHHPHHGRLCRCLHKPARLFLHNIHRAVSLSDNQRFDHQVIDTVPDKGKGQRGITSDIMFLCLKDFTQIRIQFHRYTLFHCTPSLVSFKTIPFPRSSSLISSARLKFFSFLAFVLSSIRASMSASSISSSLSTISPRISQRRTIRSKSAFAYSLELSPSAVVLTNFTSSKIAVMASAVLKSSSIASSNSLMNSAVFAAFSFSTSVICSVCAVSIRCFSWSAALVIRSRLFFAASISSALKFSGLL